MATFKITWPHGSETVVQSDCHTVDQYINCRFGGGVNIADFGASVELVPEVTEAEEEVSEAVAEAVAKDVESSTEKKESSE